ncbi:E3 ubiquitin-protein ligase TRIM56-like [Saccostrea echinata]|uniref:E3 ubiquitin-protein ligase TRIM56-like n=1 Tax=Saccostrea echinata TaxID=191078 RepID=UPI002A807D4C|nr:E3 ubiquitin-protein ligase TRIM56-like [Saccostrea echinata]
MENVTVNRLQTDFKANVFRKIITSARGDLSVPLPNCSSLIKCSICHDILKNPKILSCFHHFCAECIGEHHRQTQNGNEARCPICRRPFVLDFAGASDLPTCPYAQAMLDEIEKVKREKKEKRQTLKYCNAMCQDENVTRRAIFSCSTCPCDLCEICMKAHTKFLRTHILISLDENETDKSDPILKIITDITTSTCSLHSQSEVDQLCKACSIPFCKECERSHSGHEVITLQTIKSGTKAMREGIVKRKDVLEKFKGDLNGFMIMLQTGEEKALREISDYYTGWIQKLTEHREEISDDLRRKSTRIQNDVITHLKSLDDQSVFAERFLYNLNRLYAAGNNKSTLSTWDLIIENYEKLRENEKDDIYLPEKFAFRFVKPRQDFKIFGKIIEAKAYYDLYGMFRDDKYVTGEQENATNKSEMTFPDIGNASDNEYEYQENGQKIQDNIDESVHEDYTVMHKIRAIDNNFISGDSTGFSDDEETAVKRIESQDDSTPLTLSNDFEGGTMLPDGNILLTSFNAGELMICKESGEVLKREKAKYVWDAATGVDESGFPHVYVTFVKPSTPFLKRIFSKQENS